MCNAPIGCRRSRPEPTGQIGTTARQPFLHGIDIGAHRQQRVGQVLSGAGEGQPPGRAMGERGAYPLFKSREAFRQARHRRAPTAGRGRDAPIGHNVQEKVVIRIEHCFPCGKAALNYCPLPQ